MSKLSCDLHLHTIYSDGHHTPAEVVQRVHQAGVSVMAISDHDAVGGTKEAMLEAEKVGIRCIPAIELSTYLTQEVHILGYNIPYEDDDFLKSLAELQRLRHERIELVVDKLHRHGIRVDADVMLAQSAVGRSQVAELLIAQGFVRTKAEAFDKYIGEGAPCFVDGYRVTPEEAVILLSRFGAVPVMAHPYRFLRTSPLPELVQNLVKLGLKGLEVYYPNYGAEVRSELRSLARRKGLIATGGSDFHSAAYGTEVGQADAFLDEEAQRVLL